MSLMYIHSGSNTNIQNICNIYIFHYRPQGAQHREDTQGKTMGASGLHQSQYVTGTHLIDLQRMKGKVEAYRF